MPLTMIPAIRAAGVVAGLVLAGATASPVAAADPPASPKPNPASQPTDGNGSGVAAAPASAPDAQSTKIDAARVLENSASVLRAFPALTPETPAALLEGTAAVLAAMGFAG